MDSRIFLASACTACFAVAFISVLSSTVWISSASFGWYTSWLPLWLFPALAQRPGVPSGEPWSILYHLGGNSPWIPKINGIVADGIDPPAGCKVEQVHMVGLRD
jgi:hypothetical protein